MKCWRSVITFIFIFGVGLFIGFLLFDNRIVCSVRIAGNAYFHAIKVAEDVYLFDSIRQTEFKEQMKKATSSNKLNMWDNSTKEHILEKFKKTPPRAVIGNIVIFCDEECKNFSIIRTDSQYISPIMIWTEDNAGFQLIFNSILEEGWITPRFSGSFSYSKEGQYYRSGLMFSEQPGINCRLYHDTKGEGVLDWMTYLHDGTLTKYHLNNLTYEKVSEKSICPTDKLPNDTNSVPIESVPDNSINTTPKPFKF
jgi:hypothetical protein